MNKKLMLLMLTLLLVLAGCGQQPAKDKASESAAPDTTKEVTLKVATLIPPMTEVLDLV
ncbi:ABC transporter substrate-binding protein, partial [Clostridium perfringens]